MIIAVDHGNKQIKSIHKTFTSGYVESDFDPKLGGETIFFEGKYYTLAEKRINYLRDKSVDERFLVLTLFALAYEIVRCGDSKYRRTPSGGGEQKRD